MLKQILKDMYVSPELLAELSEDQRLLLFCKMREEQVRRFEEREKDIEKQEKKKSKKSAKKADAEAPRASGRHVDFLLAADGNEWVWVMGDHKDDLSVEQILEQEVQQKALEEAEREAELKRHEEEQELRRLQQEQQRLLEEKRQREEEVRRKHEEAELLSQKEAKKAAKKLEEAKKKIDKEGSKQLKEIQEKHDTVKRRTLERKRKLIERRSSELLGSFQKTRQMFMKLAEQDKEQLDKQYRQREEQAKAADERRRSLARSAREEFHKASMRITAQQVISMNRVVGKMSDLYQDALKLRKSSPDLKVNPNYLPRRRVEQLQRGSPTGSTESARDSDYELPVSPPHTEGPAAPFTPPKEQRAPPRVAQPPDRQSVVAWFREHEAPRGVGLDPDTGLISEWFHGIVSRPEVEHLLASRPAGSFMVRVSERVWGYAVSVCGKDGLRHFLVDTTDGHYQFFGSNQLAFGSLHDLVTHHKTHPVSVLGAERLVHPVGQASKSVGDYEELFPFESTYL